MNQEFEFFWSTNHPFSQWHLSEFIMDGHTYNCAEQYMMHQKALLFQDQEIANKILLTKNQGKQKAFGRRVKNFDQRIWKQNREEIVFKGNYAKFTQNEALGKFLLGTGEKIIVEASPVDYIWGIGMAEDHPDAQFPETWKGLNLLGKTLMRVREKMKHKIQ